MCRYAIGKGPCCPIVALALALWGCAGGSSLPDPPRLPSPQDRAQFGTIGVTAARFAPQDVYMTDRIIGKDTGATRGAGKGAAYGAMEGLFLSLQGGPLGVLFIPLMVPAGAVIGAAAGGIDGAEQSIRDDDAAQVRDCIARTLLDPEMQRAAQNSVVAIATRETSYPIVQVDESGPETPEQAVNYRGLVHRGIDTVLEIGILNVGLAGGHGDRLYVQPYLLVQARLVRVADNTEVFRRAGWYSVEYRPLDEWCANGGRLLRTALNRVHGTMAQAIVEEVFLVWRPSSED